MIKIQYLVLSIVPLFLCFHSVEVASQEEPFESSQKTIEHCLPVKPLPSKLTLDDAKRLLKANYSPTWCQLISQLGYLDEPISPSLSSQKEVGMIENRRVLQSAANECLQNNLNLEFSLKNRIIAYVNHQHQCETTGVKEACNRARGLAFNILYSDLGGKDALRMKVRLKRIVEKSKGCVKMEEVTNYCEQIGMRTSVCDKF